MAARQPLPELEVPRIPPAPAPAQGQVNLFTGQPEVEPVQLELELPEPPPRPAQEEPADTASEDASQLYVSGFGLMLGKKSERLVVKSKGDAFQAEIQAGLGNLQPGLILHHVVDHQRSHFRRADAGERGRQPQAAPRKPSRFASGGVGHFQPSLLEGEAPVVVLGPQVGRQAPCLHLDDGAHLVQSAQEMIERLEQRRSFRKYGLENARRHFHVWLRSARLGLSGKLDLLLETQEGECLPVDFKNTRRRPYGNHLLQLAGYALPVEDGLSVTVHRGFLYLIPLSEVVPVEIGPDLKSQARQQLEDIRRMLRTECMPAPTPVRAERRRAAPR